MLTGILALSSHNVYAIANGFRQDEGGPMALLHWDGHQWSRVAGGNYGFGSQPLQQMSSDGHGGLWIPMPGTGGQKSYLLHYSAGHLTTAALPGGPNRITVGTVALIPGTSGVLAGGTTHAFANPGANVTAVLLQYELSEHAGRKNDGHLVTYGVKRTLILLAACNEASVPPWQRTGDGT